MPDFGCEFLTRHPIESPFGAYLTEDLFSSTGQRNTLVEYFCWGAEVQRLSRPLVQLTSGPVQVRLRASGQIGAFREVLAQQTVRVLVRSALPRALRPAAACEPAPHLGQQHEARDGSHRRSQHREGAEQRVGLPRAAVPALET